MIIDDDFLDREEVLGVQKSLLHPSVTWHFNQSILGDTAKNFNIKNIEQSDSFQFNHIYFSNAEVVSEDADIALEIFKRFATKHQLTCNQMLRAKSNITTGHYSVSKFSPHVDYFIDHLVFIYYINDSDGDTIIYNETFSEDGDNIVLTEQQRISPKAGRGILFNGLQYHSSTPPEKSPFRAVLNISFVP